MEQRRRTWQIWSVSAAVVLVACTSPSPDPGGDAAVGVVGVRCFEGSTELTASSVLVRPDGFELRVEGSGPILLHVYRDDGSPISNHETDDPPGAASSNTVVLHTGPGRVLIECNGHAAPSDRAEPLDVRDPGGLWHEETLACEVVRGWPDERSISLPAGDPTAGAVLLRSLPGVEPTDVIDYAGYPEAFGGSTTFRIIRGGSTQAIVGLQVYEGSTYATGIACREWIAAADAALAAT